MVVFYKLVSLSNKTQLPKWLNLLTRNTHFKSRRPPVTLPPLRQNSVAIFWDLENKPAEETPYFEAAQSLKKVAHSFGLVRLMMAYGNQRTFNFVPEEAGPVDPTYKCGVCERIFVDRDMLLKHFQSLHTTENKKRLAQIESAKGSRRVEVVERFAVKMEKYKRACKALLSPVNEEYSLEEELRKVGFRVMKVNGAVGFAMESDIAHSVNTRKFECVVIVSDCMSHVGVVKAAKASGVKTVVVGPDATLKRVAHKVFSWGNVMAGEVDPLFDDDDDDGIDDDDDDVDDNDNDDDDDDVGRDNNNPNSKSWWESYR